MVSTPLEAKVYIDTPGVYDIPDDEYHADPVDGGSLSHSGARLLLPPSCPAKFDYARKHGRPPNRAFDLGHAAHRRVLGKGAALVVVDAADYRTKAAKEARDAAYAADQTPVLPHEMRQVEEMFRALEDHPYAWRLLDVENSRIEQSLFWRDDEFGVWRRARFDCWNTYIVDYKTSQSADPETFRRPLHSYGYNMQADWYLEAAAALGAPAEAFLLVVQEVEPPYLITVVQPSADAVAAGRERNRRALEMYRDCVAAGRWPGYSDEIVYLDVPRWAQYEGAFA